MEKLNVYICVVQEDKNVMTDENSIYYNELETKMLKDYEQRLQKVIEQYSNDLKSCEEESAKKIKAMEEIHKEALQTVVNQSRNDILKVEEKHRSVISKFRVFFISVMLDNIEELFNDFN